MIRTKWYITFCFYLFITGTAAKAQFINLEFDVKAELTAVVNQDLDFGTVVKNSGTHYVDLEDINAGIFAIRAFMAHNIFVVIDTPTHLSYTEGDQEYKIPLNLYSAYNNTGIDNPLVAVPLQNNMGFIPQLASGRTADNQLKHWDDIYLYIYGSIDVGDIPDGTYQADITLEVEYE